MNPGQIKALMKKLSQHQHDLRAVYLNDDNELVCGICGDRLMYADEITELLEKEDNA